MRQMFEDNNGKLSNLRVQSFIMLCGLLLATGYMLWRDRISMELLTLYALCAFAPKLVQKYAERPR